jgi:hypothetical protein
MIGTLSSEVALLDSSLGHSLCGTQGENWGEESITAAWSEFYLVEAGRRYFGRAFCAIKFAFFVEADCASVEGGKQC